MTKELVELLTDERLPNDARVLEGYSGRRMCGKETYGLVFKTTREYIDNRSMCYFNLGGDLAVEAITFSDVQRFMAEMEDLETDDMGLGIVVY